MGGLTNKQKMFIEHYLKCWNATEAARQAGYKGNNVTLASVGCENLTKPAVKEHLEKRFVELQVNRDDIPKKRKQRKSSIVYLVRAENGLVKIGKTVDIVSRFASLNSGSPLALRLITICRTPFAGDLEKHLHTSYKHKRVRGEWFSLSEEDIISIRKNHGFDE